MVQISGAIAMIGIWIILYPFTTKDVTRAPWASCAIGSSDCSFRSMGFIYCPLAAK